MKAIEQMEKAEQRKKEQSEHHGGGGGGHKSDNDRSNMSATGKRRRSSSKHSLGLNSDYNVDLASSADESNLRSGENKRVTKKKGRKNSSSNLPERRRSRVLSGGSASAMSENENLDGSSTPNTANSSNSPFRFPKTKKSRMSDWLQETEGDGDDDVSGKYLRGSRSPPGIATHLLRSAPHSPVKSVCSAKKRWLRQAISEDHSEDTIVTNGSASPVDHNSDYVTPLKKRRLASYKDDQGITEESERDAMESEAPYAPNSLKKKLLHNMVLEAVLDKAMEDMLGGKPSSPQVKTEEDLKMECPDTPSPGKENAPKIEDVENSHDEVKSKMLQEDENEVPSTKSSTSPPPPTTSSSSFIKTPEPSSVFKSFFKSNVSLEELEAEIEATKKQREETSVATAPINESPMTAAGDHLADTTKVKDETVNQEIKTECDTKPSEDQLGNLLNNSTEVKPAGNVVETIPDTNEDVRTATPSGETTTNPSLLKEEVKLEVDMAKPEIEKEPPKPKEKKRVSLADYKRRRKQEGQLSVTGKISTQSSTEEKKTYNEEGPGTPTLDEQLHSMTVPPPTLNTLPLFEKLEKLEKVHKENKHKGKCTCLVFNPPGPGGRIGGHYFHTCCP